MDMEFLIPVSFCFKRNISEGYAFPSPGISFYWRESLHHWRDPE